MQMKDYSNTSIVIYSSWSRRYAPYRNRLLKQITKDDDANRLV